MRASNPTAFAPPTSQPLHPQPHSLCTRHASEALRAHLSCDQVPLPPREEEEEQEVERRAFGWEHPMPLHDLPQPPPLLLGAPHATVGVFESQFCTHSSRARFVLCGRWVTRFPPKLTGRPPLDEIRDYFG